MNPEPLLIVLGTSVAVMLTGWLVQQRKRNPALADLLWSTLISASALYYGLVAGGALLPRLLVAMMGGIWGFRMFMHLLQRMLTEPMNARQRVLREQVGDDPLRLLALFVAKALSATLFSLPLYVAASNPRDPASAWTLLGAAIYIVALTGEAYADIQLSQFRDQPRHLGRTCRRGLWRYSRHPNYFFAIVHWTSYALIAVGLPWPLWSLTLLGPVMAVIASIRRIPAVEAQALRARGDDYRDYQRATSALVPWLPAGWPHEAPDAPSWYTPPPPSRDGGQPAARATPLPGARITPSPAVRAGAIPRGPTTPQPKEPLEQRKGEAPSSPNPRTKQPAGDVER